MLECGKILFVAGLALMALGAALWGLARIGFRGLPGDVHVQGSNWGFYFPVATCIALSIVVSLIMGVWHWLGRK